MMTQTPDIKVFDHEEVLMRLMNEKEFVRQVVDTFIDDYPSRVTALSEALSRGDFKAAVKCAHAVKGAASTAGAMVIWQLADRVEKQAETDSPGELLPMVNQLREQFEPFKKEYTKFLD